MVRQKQRKVTSKTCTKVNSLIEPINRHKYYNHFIVERNISYANQRATIYRLCAACVGKPIWRVSWESGVRLSCV